MFLATKFFTQFGEKKTPSPTPTPEPTPEPKPEPKPEAIPEIKIHEYVETFPVFAQADSVKVPEKLSETHIEYMTILLELMAM